MPAVMATGSIHNGTMAGKLNGQMPAQTCMGMTDLVTPGTGHTGTLERPQDPRQHGQVSPLRRQCNHQSELEPSLQIDLSNCLANDGQLIAICMACCPLSGMCTSCMWSHMFVHSKGTVHSPREAGGCCMYPTLLPHSQQAPPSCLEPGHLHTPPPLHTAQALITSVCTGMHEFKQIVSAHAWPRITYQKHLWTMPA